METKNKLNIILNKLDKLEKKVDKLSVIKICYFHSKHGKQADRCSGPDCVYYVEPDASKINENNHATTSKFVSSGEEKLKSKSVSSGEGVLKKEMGLSKASDDLQTAICENILGYIKATMPKFVSPIKSQPSQKKIQVMKIGLRKSVRTFNENDVVDVESTWKLSEERINEIKLQSKDVQGMIKNKPKRRKTVIFPYYPTKQ
jgi:hypothetical protein